MAESTWHRAWKDTEKFRESVVSFWVVEVIGGAIFGLSGGFWGFKLTPPGASSLTQFVYPAIGAVVGIVVGFIVTFSLIYIWYLFRAPYRQRDEARRRVRELEQIQDSNPEVPREIMIQYQTEHLATVRAHLEAYQRNFPEISLQGAHYFLGNASEDIGDLENHVRDNDYWEIVKLYPKLVDKVEASRNQLEDEIKVKAEAEIAPFENQLVSSQTRYITRNFVLSVITVALDEYWSYDPKYEWLDLNQYQDFGNYHISCGVRSVSKHQDYIKLYKGDARITELKKEIDHLRQAREAIISRLNKAISTKEYVQIGDCCPARKFKK